MKYRLFLLVLLLVNIACVGSALSVPTLTPTSAPKLPSPTPKIAVTATLDFDKFVVASDVLEVREGPGEKSLNVGYLEKGDIVTVYETKKTTLEKCLTWARIGVGRWVCADWLERAK